MNELTITAERVNALTNKSLKSNLLKMNKAILTGNKAGWDYTQALADIIAKEQFKDDYKSQSAFAKDNGIAKSSLSEAVTAYKFATTPMVGAEYDDKGHIKTATIPCSVNVAITYGKLEHTDFIEFRNWAEHDREEQVVNVLEVSSRMAKELVKEWKALQEPEEPEKPEEPQTEEPEEPQTEEPKATKEDILSTIIAMMDMYNITLEEIQEMYESTRK